MPATNVTFLRSPQLEVDYTVGASFDNVVHWLQTTVPVIAFVQAGELPHWHGVKSQHAVLVVGCEDQQLYIHDPALAHGPIQIPLADFLLAWDEMDTRCAVIPRKS